MTGDLQFDPVAHSFAWKGQDKPGVSRVLRDMGMATSWYKEDPIYRERGSAVHVAADLIDAGEFSEEGTHSLLLGYTRGYAKFLADTGFKAERSEVRVYSSAYQVAGIPDKWGYVPSRKRWLLDIKSGKSAPRGVELQLGLYRLILSDCVTDTGEALAEKFDDAKCVHLAGDGTYTLIDCSDSKWLTHSLAATNLWWLRKRWGLLNGKGNGQ